MTTTRGLAPRAVPVSEVAGTITPAPGGVGPTTIAMLLTNTRTAARVQQGIGD